MFQVVGNNKLELESDVLNKYDNYAMFKKRNIDEEELTGNFNYLKNKNKFININIEENRTSR